MRSESIDCDFGREMIGFINRYGILLDWIVCLFVVLSDGELLV